MSKEVLEKPQEGSAAGQNGSEVDTLTYDQIAEKIANEPGFANEYLHNQSKYVDENGELIQPEEQPTDPQDQHAAQGEDPPQENLDETIPQEEGSKPAEPEIDEDGYLNQKIKPEWLKPGSSVYKSVEAMSVGAAEKDRTIDFYKKNRLPALQAELEERTKKYNELSLQLEEAKKSITAKPVELDGAGEVVPVVEPVVEIPEIDLKDIEGAIDPDVFGVEESKKITDAFGKFATANKSLKEALAEKDSKINSIQDEFKKLREEFSGVKTDVSGVKSEVGDSRQNASVQAELNELNTMLHDNPDVFGEAPRTIEQMETDYAEFLRGLGEAVGVQGGIYKTDGSGAYKDEIINAMRDYSDPGSSIRAVANSSSLALPGDYEALQKVYKIRSIKNNTGQRNESNGQFSTISYARALSDFRGTTPPVAADPRQEKMQENLNRAKAVEKRADYPNQTPDTKGDNAQDIDGQGQRFMTLMYRTPRVEWNENDKKFVRDCYLKKGVPENEIDVLIS